MNIDFDLRITLTNRLIANLPHSIVRSVEFKTTAIVASNTTMVKLVSIDTMCGVMTDTLINTMIKSIFTPEQYVPVYPTLRTNTGYFYKYGMLFQFYPFNTGSIHIGVYTVNNSTLQFSDIGRCDNIQSGIEVIENFLNSTLIWGEK